ncbi:hypothetical protein BKA62DRAFT_709757 [Auriculariales sp. MPI-PUGE-AT-0066]|nr:hypothetical protein BKA62DRAFT_709757 [Auriculariales sp. MPI-PUGE-AT-0066]
MKLAILLTCIIVHLTRAAFSSHTKACRHRNCIFGDDAGTICLEADGNGIAPSECASSVLQNLIKVHHDNTNGLLIAYYDKNGRNLGGATWQVSDLLTSSVFVCMTGQRRDNPKVDRTICRSVAGDDDMENYGAHVHECVVEQPSTPRVDPCYRAVDPGSPVSQKLFYEHPIAIGIFSVLGGLVTLGTIYAAVAKWGTTFLVHVRNRWFARRPAAPRLPAAIHDRNNQRVQLNRINMPAPQPHIPQRVAPHRRAGYDLRI